MCLALLSWLPVPLWWCSPSPSGSPFATPASAVRRKLSAMLLRQRQRPEPESRSGRRSRRLAVRRSLAAGLVLAVVAGASCATATSPHGPCPKPSVAAESQLDRLREAGAVSEESPLDRWLGEITRYCGW